MNKYFEEIMQDWKNYRSNSDRTEELKKSLLDKAYNEPSDMWRIYFRADEDLAYQFNLIETKLKAQESKKKYDSFPEKAILEIIGEYAHTIARDTYTDTLDQEHVQIFIEEFKGVAGFEEAYEQAVERHAIFNEKIKLQYHDYYKEKEILPLTEIIKFTVPVKTIIYDKDDNKTIEFNNNKFNEEKLNVVIKNFNDFFLQDYMDLPFNCQKSTLKIEDHSFIFKFEITTDLKSLNKNYEEVMKDFSKKLKGQLINGWGGSVFQKQYLIGTDLVSMDFDVDHMEVTSMSPTNKHNKEKPKR